jgi:radical SAM superfamily enzyme YgiQ (UPF0313 family)
MTQYMPQHITQEFLEMIKLPDPNAKRLKYLLVLPRMTDSADRLYLFPTGFALVSSALKASGRDVYTLNLNYKADYLELLRRTVVENAIDVVATGGLSGQYAALKEILDATKAANPEVITICGGGIITADSQVAMMALETADYGVIGEGEITINELAYALETGADTSTVAGLMLNGGAATERRKEIMDLDCLPFPDYDGLEFEMILDKSKYTMANLVEASFFVTGSRSCPYNCTFCFHSSGVKYRKRSLDNIFGEIDWVLARYSKHYLYFNDEMLTSDRKFLEAFCERIKPYDFKWAASGRVDRVNHDVLKIMKDSGCFELSLGVESGCDAILKSMRKNTTVEQVERAFDAAEQVKLQVYGNLIFGDLEETSETISESIRWWKAHINYKLYLFWIYTFPGSHIYKTALERGIIRDPVQYLKDNNMQINISKMPDDVYWQTVERLELFQALYAIGIDVDFDKIDTRAYREKLNSLFDYGKIAVWPTILTIAKMLNAIDLDFLKNENVYMVNAQPKEERSKGCEPLIGKEMHLPTIIDRENIETVFYSFPQVKSNALEQISQEIRDKHPSVKRIVKLTDLLKLSEEAETLLL